VVHVASTFPPILGLDPVPESVTEIPGPDEARRELARHVDRCLRDFTRRRDPSLPLPERVVTHLSFDSPAQEIARVAQELDAHLVIVGTHGRRGLSRVILGSVAEAVVRLAPCPVLVIRPREVSVVPRIEPPCEHCVKTRVATGGRRQWCRQHSEHHGPRHTYHQGDRVASDGSMPLVFH
jgi:nucleotide-binding universal stress UspA family protein